MEIKSQININLNEGLCDALGINEDTIFVTRFENGKLIIEIVEDEDDEVSEDDLYDEGECSSGCENCEFFCHRCGKCIID